MSDQTIQMAFDNLFDDGLITDLCYVVKSGKEATVYCCQASPTLDVDLVAVKVYRPREFRSFQNDNAYQTGRIGRDRRMKKAFKKKTKKWHSHQAVSWVKHEFETMRLLYTAGADIPRPIDCSHGAIIMEYLGDDDAPAPQLNDVRLRPDQVQPFFDQLIYNLELSLACDRVHADLSSFNIIYWQESLTIIDFPQAVNPRQNRNAFSLFSRDVENVCQYFARYDLAVDSFRLARDMWLKAGL